MISFGEESKSFTGRNCLYTYKKMKVSKGIFWLDDRKPAFCNTAGVLLISHWKVPFDKSNLEFFFHTYYSQGGANLIQWAKECHHNTIDQTELVQCWAMRDLSIMSERSSVCSIRSMLQKREKKCVWFVTGHFIAAIVTQCNDL